MHYAKHRFPRSLRAGDTVISKVDIAFAFIEVTVK